jgi:hypothetical protein
VKRSIQAIYFAPSETSVPDFEDWLRERGIHYRTVNGELYVSPPTFEQWQRGEQNRITYYLFE